MAQSMTTPPHPAEHTEDPLASQGHAAQEGPTYPITDPPPGYMANARVCSFLVNVACDMCQQWLKQGQPSPSSFQWVPNDPCPYTSSQYSLKNFDLGPTPASSLIWSTFQYKGQTYKEPFGFNAMAKDGSAYYLVFRGSQTKVDFDMDGEYAQVPFPGAPQGVLISQGFATVFAGCLGEIEQALLRLSRLDGESKQAALPPPLLITGHSLGSALATLSIPLVAKSYANGVQCNQASPRVGNPAFAQLIDGFASFPTYRLVNTADLVPKLPPPPSYKHVGSEVDFTATYPTEAERHSPCCSYSYALFNPTSPVNPNITQCVGTSDPLSELPNP